MDWKCMLLRYNIVLLCSGEGVKIHLYCDTRVEYLWVSLFSYCYTVHVQMCGSNCVKNKGHSCKEYMLHDHLSSIASLYFSSQDASAGPLCILCEYVMKEVESMLDTNSTEAEIQAALDKVCGLMPSTIKSDVRTCTVVENFIWEKILQNFFCSFFAKEKYQQNLFLFCPKQTFFLVIINKLTCS